MSRILRELFDPNTAPLRTLPRSERDLAIAANNSHAQVFENISHLPDRTVRSKGCLSNKTALAMIFKLAEAAVPRCHAQGCSSGVAVRIGRRFAFGDLRAPHLLAPRPSPASRPSGEWNDDDYDILADGVVVGRIFKVHAAPVG